MAVPEIASPAALRSRVVFVDVPNTEPPVRIKCRRPDLQVLVAEGWLPLDIYGAVVEAFTDSSDLQSDDARVALITERAKENPRLFDEFVERWVCAASIEPKFVLTEAEVGSDPSRMWIDELDGDVRLLIFAHTRAGLTSKKARVLLEDFRRQQSAGDSAGSGSEAVRAAALEPVTH